VSGGFPRKFPSKRKGGGSLRKEKFEGNLRKAPKPSQRKGYQTTRIKKKNERCTNGKRDPSVVEGGQ